MLRVTLIPRGAINHGGDKPWCIQSERYPIRGWKANAYMYTSFALYLKVFKNHFYYFWHVKVLSIKPCLRTQLPERNRSYWKVSRGWGHWITWNGHMMGLLNSFSASRWGNLSIFQKFKCLGGCLGRMFKLRFDWYIKKLCVWVVTDNRTMLQLFTLNTSWNCLTTNLSIIS